MMVFN